MNHHYSYTQKPDTASMLQSSVWTQVTDPNTLRAFQMTWVNFPPEEIQMKPMPGHSLYAQVALLKLTK